LPRVAIDVGCAQEGQTGRFAGMTVPQFVQRCPTMSQSSSELRDVIDLGPALQQKKPACAGRFHHSLPAAQVTTYGRQFIASEELRRCHAGDECHSQHVIAV
jgi:hypothetical protein